MKLMFSLLAAGAALVGWIYYSGLDQDTCQRTGFGMMASVEYCTRPDGSIYLKNQPSGEPVAPAVATPTGAVTMGAGDDGAGDQ